MTSGATRAHDVHTDGVSPRWTLIRRCALTVLAVTVLCWWWFNGVPLDFFQIYAWALGFLVVGCLGRSRAWVLSALRSWGGFIALIVVYQFGYGEAGRFYKSGDLPVQGDHNIIGMPLHVDWPVHVDKFLFGGMLPNVYLQEHFHAQGVPWFAWITTLTYCSHFIFAPLAAIILWLRGSALFKPWIRSVMALAGLGLVTYFLFPMAPPWMASQQGYITWPLDRTIGDGWSQLDIHSAQQLLNAGEALSNPCAAMPSLHMATATLAALILPWRSRWYVRMCALLYPATMAFSLVYGAEHYVIDELVGVAYALGIVLGWRLLARRFSTLTKQTPAREQSDAATDTQHENGGDAFSQREQNRVADSV